MPVKIKCNCGNILAIKSRGKYKIENAVVYIDIDVVNNVIKKGIMCKMCGKKYMGGENNDR